MTMLGKRSLRTTLCLTPKFFPSGASRDGASSTTRAENQRFAVKNAASLKERTSLRSKVNTSTLTVGVGSSSRCCLRMLSWRRGCWESRTGSTFQEMSSGMCNTTFSVWSQPFRKATSAAARIRACDRIGTVRGGRRPRCEERGNTRGARVPQVATRFGNQFEQVAEGGVPGIPPSPADDER